MTARWRSLTHLCLPPCDVFLHHAVDGVLRSQAEGPLVVPVVLVVGGGTDVDAVPRGPRGLREGHPTDSRLRAVGKGGDGHLGNGVPIRAPDFVWIDGDGGGNDDRACAVVAEGLVPA